MSGMPAADVTAKVERFVHSVLDPYVTAGVLDEAERRRIVGSVARKVVAAHEGDTDASFIVRNGPKIRSVAEQYVQALQRARAGAAKPC